MDSVVATAAPERYSPPRAFTRAQRDRTTVLFGGLTRHHEQLIRAVLTALGYRAEIVPTPTIADFQAGKEFGNYGQCNPTYFTTGALVNYLQRLRSGGHSVREVLDNYVYLTATSPCGPCRFGMYQNEYRLALENAGFAGFRVITFDQKPVIRGDPAQGMDVNIDFSFAVLYAVLLGDLLNEMGYALRPYERNPGQTDRILQRGLALLVDTLSGLAPPVPVSDRPSLWARRFVRLADQAHLWSRYRYFFHGAYRSNVRAVLTRIGAWFEEVELDRTRVKPIVKVTGEFWAQVTEGDGNYRMFSFLEDEGAAPVVEPVATWLNYLLYVARIENRTLTRLVDKNETDIRLADRLRGWLRYRKRDLLLRFMTRRLLATYNELRTALHRIPHELVDQNLLGELAHDFYHTRVRGGEGHLEVGKNIYVHRRGLAHMVLSLKPFGCMPSTQSDGVQAAVLGAYGDMNFLPLETSGEGEVNAHSRVQMALGEAQDKARREYARALADCDLTTEAIEQFVAARPALRQPSYRVPQRPGIVGSAANFAHHISDLMRSNIEQPDPRSC